MDTVTEFNRYIEQIGDKALIGAKFFREIFKIKKINRAKIFLFLLFLILKVMPANAQILQRIDCSKKIPISTLPEDKKIQKIPPGCFDSDTNEPGIANFIMNGIKLDIPRNYIVFNPLEADGISRGTQLEMIYPEMEPRKNLEKNTMKVNIHINARSSVPKNRICNIDNPKWCYPLNFIDYAISGIGYYGSSEEEYLARLPKKENIKYDKELGLSYFNRSKSKQDTTIYFRGDVKYPDYWIICQASCETWFNLKDNKLYINYRYPKYPLLKKYNDVHQKVLAKIESFITESKKE